MASVDEALKETFCTLFMEQRYSDITVDKLCQTAKASRSAFYKRYANKDELLVSILADDLVKPAREFRQAVPTRKFADHAQPMVDSLQYERILERRDFYKKVLRECSDVVLHGLTAAFADFNREVMAEYPFDDVERDYVASVYAADHVFWMAKWIHDDFSISVDELVRLHRKWSVGTWESIIGEFE